MTANKAIADFLFKKNYGIFDDGRDISIIKCSNLKCKDCEMGVWEKEGIVCSGEKGILEWLESKQKTRKTNLENNADEIANALLRRTLVGVDKKTGKITSCCEMECRNCLFLGSGNYAGCNIDYACCKKEEGRLKEWFQEEAPSSTPITIWQCFDDKVVYEKDGSIRTCLLEDLKEILCQL